MIQIPALFISRRTEFSKPPNIPEKDLVFREQFIFIPYENISSYLRVSVNFLLRPQAGQAPTFDLERKLAKYAAVDFEFA
jgi:hypothetical protein